MNALESIKTNRTFRRFDQSKSIPKDLIAHMQEAVRYSPTGRNGQTMHYIFVQSPDLVAAIFPHTHYAGALPPELGTPKEGEKPTLFVVLLEEGPTHTPIDDINAGIGMTNLRAVAWEAGVGSVILKNINKAGIADVLAVDAERINALVAFGYPAHKVTVVAMPEDGNVNYYLDDNKDYVVPKKSVEELTEIR